MDIQPTLIREKAAEVSHFLAFFYALVGLHVLLFGGFRFAIGNFIISATQLRNPIVFAVLLTLIGRWLSPATTLQATPMVRSVRAALELGRRIKGKRNGSGQLWMALLFLNVLLFLPSYLSHFRTSTFLPLPPLDGLRGWIDTLLFFVRRENQDIFRVCGDFFLIITIWNIAARTSRGPWVGRSCVFIYFGLLSYQLYEAISLILFSQTSLIYDDLLLLRDAAYLFVDIMSWKLLHSALQIGSWLVIGLTAVFYAFSVVKYHFAHYRIRHTAMLIGAGGWIVVATFTFWFGKTDPRPTVQWIASKALLNVKESVKFARVLHSGLQETPHEYDFSSVKLKDPPDIYFFVVEAYGKIITEHPMLKEEFTQEMLQWQNQFEKAGWSMTTNFSEAPVSGGKSWLSVATLMCGLNVSNQTIYALLLKQFSDYPHLVRFLQAQSYYSIILQPPVQRRRTGFDFESYENFYGYHRYIYYDDLHYSGQRFGWGIVPDQFSLNSAHEQFIIQAPHPLFFLFTTVTSHAPWLDLPPYVDDWKDLNNLTEDAGSESKRRYGQRLKHKLGLKEIVNLEDYLRHINYQFRVIEAYVSQKVTDNSVVVIVGDHQPSIFTEKSHGFQTPIHILSRDTTFVSFFSKYGFVEGLVKDPVSYNSIRHEGFYSLFLRALAKRYDLAPDNALPIYYPEGISLLKSRNSN